MELEVDATAPRVARERNGVVRALGDLIGSGDEADRCYACRALGVLADRAALPLLVERLEDPDIDVCVEAAGALGALGDPAAVGALCKSLAGDPDGEIKLAAARALGQIGAAEAIPVLLEVAACRPGDMAVDDASDWDPWWDVQLAAVEALGRLRSEAAIPVLEALLDDEEGQDIEVALVRALAEIGGRGEEILTGRLAGKRSQPRRRAIRALGRSRSDATLAPLAERLLDPLPEVRVATLEALTERGNRAYLRAVLTCCRDPDPSVRAAAIRAATGLAGGEGAVVELDRIVAGLDDPDPRVRAVVLEILPRCGAALGDEALERAREAALDSDPAVAAAACAVLAETPQPESAARLLELLSDPSRPAASRRAALRAVGGRGEWNPGLADCLARVLADDDQSVRASALDTLVQLEPAATRAVPELPAPRPVEIVIAALRGELSGAAPATAPAEPGRAQDDPVESETPPAAVEPDPSPTRPARSSLEAIALDNAESALAASEAPDAASETDFEPDARLAEYLRLVERNEVTAQWLFSRDSLPVPDDVRRLAAQALANADGSEAVSALIEALASPLEVVPREAAASLAAIAQRADAPAGLGEAVAPLRRLLGTPDRALRIGAARALGFIGDEAARPDLMAALEDEEISVQIQAIEALAELDARAPGPATGASSRVNVRLVELLEHPEVGVRLAAARGVARLAARTASPGAEPGLDVIGRLIETAFRGGGAQARTLGRMLSALDAPQASERLVACLKTLPSSAERRFAIEMLEEIHRPGSA